MKQITLTRLFGVAVAGVLAGEFTPSVRADADDKPAAKAAGDAAADPDDQVGVELLEVLDAAQIGKHLFLRLFAHGTGVEENDVRVFGTRNLDQGMGDIGRS